MAGKELSMELWQILDNIDVLVWFAGTCLLFAIFRFVNALFRAFVPVDPSTLRWLVVALFVFVGRLLFSITIEPLVLRLRFRIRS
ncbi:MAG: hypothetical protein WAN50_04940 [Minisyncoccia bacterium]